MVTHEERVRALQDLEAKALVSYHQGAVDSQTEEQIVAIATNGLTQGEESALYAFRASSRRRQGAPTGSCQDWFRVAELRSHNASILRATSGCRAEQGDKPGALADLYEALSYAPGEADLYREIGRLHRDLGDNGAAIDAFATAGQLEAQQQAIRSAAEEQRSWQKWQIIGGIVGSAIGGAAAGAAAGATAPAPEVKVITSPPAGRNYIQSVVYGQ